MPPHRFSHTEFSNIPRDACFGWRNKKLGRGYKPRPVKENMKEGLMVGNQWIGNAKRFKVLCARQIASTQ